MRFLRLVYPEMGAVPKRKKPPISGRPRPGGLPALTLHGIFRIAESLVRRALGLVNLAFGLQLLVAPHRAGCVLDSAFDLVCRALNVFLCP
jgi:hypothetical protein